MKMILAQGNPGAEYEKTRHNVGFLAIDFFAKKHGLQFQPKSKFFSDIAEFSMNDEKILLIKPTTFYNETGKSARVVADFYKVDTKDILVIHDELALPFGTLRTREKGSDAGNNGIKSLNAHLGEKYARLRVGTWNDLLERMGSFDFVLSKFTSDEFEKLNEDIFPKITEILDGFISGNFDSASHTM
jgi:peptidyl-tRNA hydrolase, PTH1 family